MKSSSTHNRSPSTPALDTVLFLCLGAFWGGSFIAIKIVVEILPPWFSGSLRMLVALLALQVIFQFSGHRPKLQKNERFPVWIAGLCTIGIPFALLFWAEQHISGGLGGIMNGTTPLWTALLLMFMPSAAARPRTKLRPTFKMIMGLLMGFIGITIIFWPKLNFNHGLAELLGLVAAFLMAVMYGVSNLLNKALTAADRKLDLRTLVYQQHLISFIFLTALSLAFEPWPTLAVVFSPKPLIAILYLGIVSSSIALIIHFHLIRKWGALKTSGVTYLIPISALIFDALILGNAPEESALAGIAFVMMGLFFVRSDQSNH